MTDPTTAASRLAVGGLVALPTETVYGLAGRADNDRAVERIFEVKQRPANHPLIAHFATPDPAEWESEGWVKLGTLRSTVMSIADELWPGPLTVIVSAGKRLSHRVTAGRGTVGVRVPDHVSTIATIASLGVPVAAPSANRYGRVSPTTATHVLDDLGAVLDPATDGVLDGGSSPVGVESTIVDLTSRPPQLLRHGAIGERLLTPLVGELAAAKGPARASGMHAAHYAPQGQVVLVDTLAQAERAADQLRAQGSACDIVDRSGDPLAAARHLYVDLRRANGEVDALVFVMPSAPHEQPLHHVVTAVRDRLTRAATGTRSNRVR